MRAAVSSRLHPTNQRRGDASPALPPCLLPRGDGPLSKQRKQSEERRVLLGSSVVSVASQAFCGLSKLSSLSFFEEESLHRLVRQGQVRAGTTLLVADDLCCLLKCQMISSDVLWYQMVSSGVR